MHTSTTAVDVPIGSPAPPTRPARNRVGTRSALARSEERSAFIVLAPWLAGLVLITVGPMLASLYFSFTDYNTVGSATWIGLENYKEILFQDPRFRKAVVVTATYVLFSVPLVLIFSLALALILNQGTRLLPLYRALYYLPSLIGGSVSIALLWRQVFGDQGLVNRILGIFGIQGPAWLGEPDRIIYALIALNVWTFGSAMIIFLAGIRQVPRELYEAAAIDGAGAVRKFLHITLPMITPVVLFNTILNIINSFQAFTPAFIISGGTGGPIDSTLFYTLYIYQEGFTKFNMGYAAALAWLLLIGIAFFTFLIMATSNRWVFYADGR